jgi:hypothetical protein
MVWVGRVISALPVLGLAMSAAMKLKGAPEVVEHFTGPLGYPAGTLTSLSAVELLCTVLYVIPHTAILGAILLTGYLGGAVATHLRVGEGFLGPLAFGVLVWVGIWLREPRLRAVLPLRKV